MGSHLTDAPPAAGRRIVAMDNLAAGRLANLAQHQDNPAFRFVEGDINGDFSMAEAAWAAGVRRMMYAASGSC